MFRINVIETNKAHLCPVLLSLSFAVFEIIKRDILSTFSNLYIQQKNSDPQNLFAFKGKEKLYTALNSDVFCSFKEVFIMYSITLEHILNTLYIYIYIKFVVFWAAKPCSTERTDFSEEGIASVFRVRYLSLPPGSTGFLLSFTLRSWMFCTKLVQYFYIWWEILMQTIFSFPQK
jgi:hypothetical protein